MIRTFTGRAALLARLGADAPVWRTEAHQGAERNRAAGKHDNRSANSWSRLKPGLAELQRGKCAYCETYLGSEGVDWTVDHYRPKGRVAVWADPDAPEIVDVGGPAPTGYHLLAHDPDNLLGSCENCNRRKAAYFPTAAPRVLDSTDRAGLAAERPYLVDPADPAADPERLITWKGAIPQPAPGLDEHDRRRARATIEVLELARTKVVADRMLLLIGVWMAHDAGAADVLDLYCAPGGRFAACARRYRELCETDPEWAAAEYRLMITSVAGGVGYR
ncbi:hypothetical protein V5P93_004792 [Actinokineospora auranticolor]|uniref:HNH endonuclease n=1 Tax=Actinokineospora auranticolor TaxID=155976 RepID=A0A2S6GNE2_9PSEU|nr:hypothetical protein [Actinokineospora auranticolor]PPK66754.1 hypothetical protein CLV40_109139 [Actinokineospora auranticolor]